MKILASAWGSTGDHVPVANLIKFLVQQGYTIHVLASEAYADLYRELGITFHALRSINIEEYPASSLQKSGEIIRRFIDPLCNEQFASALELIERQSIDLVLSSWMTPGVVAAAQALKVRVIPLFQHPLSLMLPNDLPVFTRWPRLTARNRFPTRNEALRRSILRYYRKLAPRLMLLRSTHGLPDDEGLLPGTGGRGAALFPREFISGETNHVFLPPSPPTPKEGIPGDLPEFLLNGKPPWLIFLGSFARMRADFVRSLVGALLNIEERCVVVWGVSFGLGMCSKNLRELPRFPIAQLLPYVRAVVHHGGINTATETLAAGKPAIAVPHWADQLDNAYRLRDMGVGTFLLENTITDLELKQNFLHLLSSSCGEAAVRISQSITSHHGTSCLPK